MNYHNFRDVTRITKFQHLTAQAHAGTSIVRAYHQAEGFLFFGIRSNDRDSFFMQYQLLADALPKFTFLGRLSEYFCYSLVQVVGAALFATRRVLEK